MVSGRGSGSGSGGDGKFSPRGEEREEIEREAPRAGLKFWGKISKRRFWAPARADRQAHAAHGDTVVGDETFFVFLPLMSKGFFFFLL